MFLTYLIEILQSLRMIHVGSFVLKIKASAKLAVLISPIILFFEKIAGFIMVEKLTNWISINVDYITIVLLAIAVDHVLGSFKHFFLYRDFSLVKNITGISTKIGLVVSVGFLFEGLSVIIEHDSFMKDYLIIVTRSIVFLYPAGSAFGNSSIISGGKFPPDGWLKKIKQFQDNMNPEEFRRGNHDHDDLNVNDEEFQNQNPN